MQRIATILTTPFVAANAFAVASAATSTLTYAQPSTGAIDVERVENARPPKRPDLADTVVGTYFGDVISDARGSSQSNVTLYVSKVNRSTVGVSSDYARLPTVDVPISVYGNQVIQNRVNAVFVLNRNKQPQTLDFNPDGSVSFAGTQQQQ